MQMKGYSLISLSIFPKKGGRQRRKGANEQEGNERLGDGDKCMWKHGSRFRSISTPNIKLAKWMVQDKVEHGEHARWLHKWKRGGGGGSARACKEWQGSESISIINRAWSEARGRQGERGRGRISQFISQRWWRPETVAWRLSVGLNQMRKDGI